MSPPTLLRGRVARSNVEVHPRPAAPSPLPDLVRRRAALLASGPSATAELRSVTDELLERLSVEGPRVRRVEPGEPAALLSRLVADEPVHPFSAADREADLADRLDADRRCFVLEHPSLPGHPMNVVWVALSCGTERRIDSILDPAAPTLDPAAADTAVFYSIWNVEPGLVGIPGGTALLDGAIEMLQAEFPGLSEFVTLSPIPGFRRWWNTQRDSGADDDSPDVAVPSESLRSPMTAACAEYLCTTGSYGRPIDAVARFHMGNGARLVGLNWAGDQSPNGLRRSFGLMANYRYAPEDRERNRQDLAVGRPAVSGPIGRLLHG